MWIRIRIEANADPKHEGQVYMYRTMWTTNTPHLFNIRKEAVDHVPGYEAGLDERAPEHAIQDLEVAHVTALRVEELIDEVLPLLLPGLQAHQQLARYGGAPVRHFHVNLHQGGLNDL
jgi:hypothetical protein